MLDFYFYGPHDNIDCVLDSVLDDALLFSESGEGNFIDLINTVGKKEVDINEPIYIQLRKRRIE